VSRYVSNILVYVFGGYFLDNLQSDVWARRKFKYCKRRVRGMSGVL